jgi:uncharacterized protein YqeY
MVGKNDGNRDSTDQEVEAVVQKFLKNNAETLTRVADPTQRERYESERAILQRYVPVELTETELRAVLVEFAQGEPLTLKDTGRVKQALQASYPGRVNGRILSDILKAGVS